MIQDIISYFKKMFMKKNKTHIKIGKLTFRPGINEDLIDGKVLMFLNGPHWKLNTSEYNYFQFDQIFKYLVDCPASQLQFSHNQTKNLLQDISHLHFISLKILNLSDSMIKSIQVFSWMDFTQIEDIQIHFNCITSIRSLTKMNSKCLKGLRLNQNPIKDLRPLNRVQFCKKQVKLRIQGQGHVVLDENIAFVAKLGVLDFNNLNCQSDERIFNKKKVDALVHKYKNACLHPLIF